MKNAIKFILLLMILLFISCNKENKKIKILEVKKEKKIKKKKNEVYITFNENYNRMCEGEDGLITHYYKRDYNEDTIDFYFCDDFYEFTIKDGERKKISLKHLKNYNVKTYEQLMKDTLHYKKMHIIETISSSRAIIYKDVKYSTYEEDEVYILFDETSERKCEEVEGDDDVKGIITPYYNKLYNEETIDFYFCDDLYEFTRKDGEKKRISLKHLRKYNIKTYEQLMKDTLDYKKWHIINKISNTKAIIYKDVEYSEYIE